MKSLNRATIMGHVGQPPKIAATRQGKTVATISIATTDKWKDKQGNPMEDTQWHRVVCFEPIANWVQQYVQQGDPIFIEGQIKTREWTDKQNVKRYTTEITAKEINFLPNNRPKAAPQQVAPPQQGRNPNASPYAQQQAQLPANLNASAPAWHDDDIPF